MLKCDTNNYDIPMTHTLLVAGFVKYNKKIIYQNIADLILLFYAKPLNLHLTYNNETHILPYCPVSDNWWSMIAKIRLKYRLIDYIEIHLTYDNQYVYMSNWYKFSRYSELIFTVITSRLTTQNELVSTLKKALMIEYNIEIAECLGTYLICEAFDDQTTRDDIEDVGEADLDNCSIIGHLEEMFPNVFCSSEKQIRLLKVLQDAVNGILPLTPKAISPCRIDDIVATRISREEVKNASELMNSICPGMMCGKNKKYMMDVIAIGLKNDIPLLNWLTDTFCRYRINEYILKQRDINIWNILKQYKFLKHPKMGPKSVETFHAAMTGYFRGRAFFNPILLRHPVCLIDDSLNDFATYYIAMSQVIDTLTTQQHVHINPCQIDMFIIPKNVKSNMKQVSNKIELNDPDIDEDFDDDDDEFELEGIDIIGNIDCRLKENKWVYIRKEISDVNVQRIKRILYVSLMQQINQRPNQRIIVYIDRRNPKYSDMNKKEFTDYIQSDYGMNEKRKKERNTEKNKTWKDRVYITQAYDKKYSTLPAQYTPEGCLWVSQECILPMVKQEQTHSNRVNRVCYGARHDLNGFQFILSFHIESVHNIRCYWYKDCWMTRFLPCDIYHLWPMYFAKRTTTKNQTLHSDLYNTLRQMEQIRDIGFKTWYETTTKTSLIPIQL